MSTVQPIFMFSIQYAEFKAVIAIESLSVIRGHLPRRAQELVLDWTELHQQGKRLSNPPLRVGADQANADFFQFHGRSSWSRLLGQVGSFSSTSQRYAKGSTPLSLQVSMML